LNKSHILQLGLNFEFKAKVLASKFKALGFQIKGKNFETLLFVINEVHEYW